jgi:hypothetical protein
MNHAHINIGKHGKRKRSHWSAEQDELLIRAEVIARHRAQRLNCQRFPFWPIIGEIVGHEGDTCRRRSVILCRQIRWKTKYDVYSSKWSSAISELIAQEKYTDLDASGTPPLNVTVIVRELEIFSRIVSYEESADGEISGMSAILERWSITCLMLIIF